MTSGGDWFSGPWRSGHSEWRLLLLLRTKGVAIASLGIRTGWASPKFLQEPPSYVITQRGRTCPDSPVLTSNCTRCQTARRLSWTRHKVETLSAPRPLHAQRATLAPSTKYVHMRSISCILRVQGGSPPLSVVHGWLNIEYPASTFEFCRVHCLYARCMPSSRLGESIHIRP